LHIIFGIPSLVSSSVSLFVEKLFRMGPDFQEYGEEASFHHKPEEFDDTSQYVSGFWQKSGNDRAFFSVMCENNCAERNF